MAKNHSSVVYVEPNYTFSGLTAVAGDGSFYDRAPDLEDYCIGLDIIVGLSSRHKVLKKMDEDDKVIIMSYTDGSNGKGSIRFMSGSRVGGYEKSDDGTFHAKMHGQNVLTSYYADMHITDLVDYGTTELLGIKSVDVDYNSTCVPVITVKFTDVRGLSLFQPSELNDDISFNGIRGFSKENIAQSFFHAFFTLPIPKFTVILKGFYGDPVSYQVMCDKFDTAFDSRTGSFDVTARFIGYAYSFMSDVSFNALLAAPYSDYKGEEYWDTQVKAERFMLTDKNGIPTKMPKLYEIRSQFESIVKKSDEKSHDSTDEAEDESHELEIAELTKMKRMYRTWYDALYNLVVTKYGKDFCYRYGGSDVDDDYRMVVIFTNGVNIKGNDLSEEYKQFDTSFRDLTGQLRAAVDEFNKSNKGYRKLNNVLDGFKYPRVKTFKDIWYNDKKGTLMFDGFHHDNVLPREETIDMVFGKDTNSQQNALKKLYNDGRYQYIDAFVIDLDYSDLKKRINKLNELASKKSDDKEKKRKELNKHMYEEMGWYPSIENFTKIVMAHLETLMAIMYGVVDKAEGRTVSDLAVATGDEGVVDVNDKDDEVAPFPRLTKLVTDEDGYSKSEDAWAGDFTDGIGFAEVDAVNGLLNGAAKIVQLEKETQTVINNNNSTDEVDKSAVTCVEMPITAYDFVLTKNPYGGDDVKTDADAFAGKVCMRMFGILGLNFFRRELQDSWVSLAGKLGKIEAHNFHKLNKIGSVRLLEAIGENGPLKNGEEILKIVTTGKGIGKTLPWETKNGGAILFEPREKLWLTRYRIAEDKRSVHPIQNMSFNAMEIAYGGLQQNKLPINNEDVVIFDSYNKLSENFAKLMRNRSNSTIFNTIKFTDQYKQIWDIVENAEANGIDEYKEVMQKVGDNIKPNIDQGFMNGVILEGSLSFNSVVDSSKLLPLNKTDKHIPIFYNYSDTETMFAGSGDTKSPYSFNNSSYVTEMVDRNLQSYTLTECFGYKVVNGVYELDKTKSLFSQKSFQDINTGFESKNKEMALSSSVHRMMFFVMGFDCINYASIARCISNTSYSYVPNLAALQIGAVLALFYTSYSISRNIDLSVVSKHIPVPKGFHHVEDVINNMTPYCKIGFAKYFVDWATKNHWRLKSLYIKADGKGGMTCEGKHYEKMLMNKDNYNLTRALFRQDSSLVKRFTNDLMSLVCIVRMTVNASDGASEDWSTKEYTYGVNRTYAKAYLDSFIQELRELNGVSEKKGGDPTTIAQNPSQANNDIKIELYRYLKQLHDKWITTADMDIWMFDKFFGEENKGNPMGNNFFFIDSFYNKIGNKLLINPSKVSEALKLAISSMDTNTMMYTFLAEVYGEHRCMIKCVQNFKLLSEGIKSVFTPVPYNLMGKPDPMPDFVVVYTYEASRNLSIKNSEYKDDGFMLNDEFDTPMPIKSRGDENKYYKIPAFGVSYGRQYQSYFKSVKVDMSHPVMTEQAIIAKHNILAASRDETTKGVTAQDLYDIFSNQSYTCVVDMMGCAYVQPLMYFVLLNVPFFKGSYLISKVRHRMLPGDMTTEITGVRMSKYCNKMVEDIFTDEEDTMEDGSANDKDSKPKSNGGCTDCDYKVYPIGNDVSVLSGSDVNKAKQLIDKLMERGFNEIAAAGIVGNMYVETLPHFDHMSAAVDSDKYIAAGLCAWNDHYGNLTHLLQQRTERYGDKEEDGSIRRIAAGLGIDGVKKKLLDIGLDYQIQFVSETVKSSLKNSLNACTSASAAADLFRRKYEVSESHISQRKSKADEFYKEHRKGIATTPVPAKKANNPQEYSKMYVDAIQKTLNSTSYAGELDVQYAKNGAVRIGIKDNNRDKLATLFDIILNSDEYYNNMNNLNWVYKSSPSELPSYVEVFPKAGDNSNTRKIYVYKDGKIDTAKSKLNGTDDCNERLIQSLAKRYSSNKDIFSKECPQFSEAKDCIDKVSPASCGSLKTGNGSSNNEGTPSNGKTKTRQSQGETSVVRGGNWNVTKATNWIKANAKSSSAGKCGKYVRLAINEGFKPAIQNKIPGIPGEYATNLHYNGILKDNGFNLEYSGMCTKDNRSTSFKVEPGDVAVIGWNVGAGEPGAYHACMYTDKGWYSDFAQGERMSPYGSDFSKTKNKWNYPKSKGYKLPYFIYRYTGNKA